uniref:Malectin-like domain-containing protein n=1 Tax=Aegilops tauschii subsp. strangulata TaxID=200361 RepID=A0A453HU11_AEGTS
IRRAPGGMLPRHSFISIDCGYTANQTYTDSRTGISYASDEGYTDAGLIHPVDKGNLQTDLAD